MSKTRVQRTRQKHIQKACPKNCPNTAQKRMSSGQITRTLIKTFKIIKQSALYIILNFAACMNGHITQTAPGLV